MSVRLSLIRDSDWDEAARVRLASDSKQLRQHKSSSSDTMQHVSNNNNTGALYGISSKTEWHDKIAHAWAVESVPKSTRFDDASTSGISGSQHGNSATAATPATTPFRSSASSSASGLNRSATKPSQQQNESGGKYVAVCLGTLFTHELCRNPAGALPVQALARMRSSGSGPVSVLCNVALLINQNVTGTVTMRDLTAQLVPEEIVAEVARYSGFAVNEPGQPQTPAGSILEANEAACKTLQLPSTDFRFIRCGAEAYGATHVSSPVTMNNSGSSRSGSNSNNTPFIRGDSQLMRLSLAQRAPDAAMLESLIESLAESESFQSVMGKASIVFSLFDENTHSSAQVWFVSDAQLPFFGANVANGLFTPGLWSAGALSHQSAFLLSTLATDNVLFASSALFAQHSDQFDRILAFSVAASAAVRSAIAASNEQSARGGGGGGTAHQLIQKQQEEQGQQLNTRRSQLLKVRQQHEQQLADLQHRIHSGSGTAGEKLAAERQYQRLLMGELELLEHRVEEVKQLTDQERLVAEEIDAKQKVAQQRVSEVEEHKKNLVTEYRSLTEETRSSGAVAESLQTQISLLEQRLAVASSSIVNYRAAAESKQKQSADAHTKMQRAKELSTKHELALADAQRHFSQVQQTVADDTRDAEEAHKLELKSLQQDIATMQQQNDTYGTKLGEMKANLHATETLRRSLEKEYDEVREAMHALLQKAPELASAQPGGVLDERRDKLSRSVAESKEGLAELKGKLEEAKHRRDSAEEHVLASERLLQRSLATVQLRIPPLLESHRENLSEEEQHARRALELETEADYYVFQNSFYLSLFDRVHRHNSLRHRQRHEELRLELDVADEKLRETGEKLRTAEAVSDVFAKRMEECAREQQRLRDEHKASVDALRQDLLTAESEPVEMLVKKDAQALAAKIAQTSAEVELLEAAMLKAPSGGIGVGSAPASRSGSSNHLLSRGGLMGAGGGYGGSQSTLAASLASSSTTFAGHRSLRAAAPVPAEVRDRLKSLRRESHRKSREENAKAAELEQRLDSRRRELSEKSSILSTMRGSISELHEQLQLRTAQMDERNKEIDLLSTRDETLVRDLEEELEFAQEIGNRHRNENRMQLARVTQMMTEQETELSRSRHEVAKLEKARNDIVRRMSESNEQTLLMELEHEQKRREELREQLADAGVAPSPSRGGGGGYYDDEEELFDEEDDNNASVYSGATGSRHASVSNYFSSQPRHSYMDPARASPIS